MGIAPFKKRKKRAKYYNDKYNDTHKREVELKFASMEEFRQAVRDNAIRDKRVVHFITNNKERVQVDVIKVVHSTCDVASYQTKNLCILRLA